MNRRSTDIYWLARSAQPMWAAVSLVVAALLLPASTASAGEQAIAQGEQAQPALSGRVLAGKKPLETASVYVYEIRTASLQKLVTDVSGRFLLPQLSAGLFQIIASKSGFVPRIEQLQRDSAEANQTLDLKLTPEDSRDLAQVESYWELRRRIPPDVLRDIKIADWTGSSGIRQPIEVAGGAGSHSLVTPVSSRLQTNMIAHSGIESLGGELGDLQVAGAGLGIRAEMGAMAVGVTGQFQQLEPSAPGPSVAQGQRHQLEVHLDSPQQSRVEVHTSSADLSGRGDGEQLAGIDMEHYRVQWSGPSGQKAHSGVSANYTEENNFYQSTGGVDPAHVPGASQTLDLEGFYRRELTAKTKLETGIRFRQREGLTRGLTAGSIDQQLSEETMGLYGKGTSQIQPRVLVEYGLYSQYQDGDLSLMPHAGLVVDLNDSWKARGAFAKRTLDDRSSPYQRFHSAFYSDRETCNAVGESCYEVSLTREGSGDDEVRLGAVHREYAETLRVYFSRDFFDRLESLYMVRGDQVQDLQFSVVRRLAPKILARLESNLASGGGGIFYATDQRPYQNQVRYLVTSIDTRFQQTATGVFVAFHHLEQDFNPLDDQGQKDPSTGTTLEMQRLQLMLTQDLRVLADLASNWAVRFNMEVSRGSTPYTLTTDDELFKKLTAGFSVSF